MVIDKGPHAAIAELNVKPFDSRMANLIMKIYEVVGVYYAERTLREINRSAGKKGFGFDAEWIAQIQSFFRLHLLSKAVIPINETTKAFILKVIQQGIDDGLGSYDIARMLAVNEMTVHRAAMIVRTEAGKAVFEGEELGKEKAEFETVEEWIAANDHRTRHSHRLVDGHKIESGGKFVVPVFDGKVRVGDELMRGPGDPEASAGNVINCRCKRAATAKRDRDGKLVMRTL